MLFTVSHCSQLIITYLYSGHVWLCDIAAHPQHPAARVESGTPVWRVQHKPVPYILPPRVLCMSRNTNIA